jgi:hypothetical protein
MKEANNFNSLWLFLSHFDMAPACNQVTCDMMPPLVASLTTLND